jgi:hypothetical protein
VTRALAVTIFFVGRVFAVRKMVYGRKNRYAGCSTRYARHSIAWVLLCATVCVSQALWGQVPPRISSQTIKSQRAESVRQLLPMPNLIWRSRQNAVDTLKAVGLNQGNVVDDGQDTSVVIEQSVAPGTQVAAGSMIGYTLRRPKFVLTPSEFRPGVGKTVHFDAELVPPLTSPERIVRIYIFTFSQTQSSEQGETSQSHRETKPSTDYTFERPGNYLVVVSASLNGINLASDPVEIQVQNPISATTPTSTPTPRNHHPTPTPTRTRGPEPIASPSIPAESHINWTAVLKAVLLLAVVLSTLAVARRYYKRKNARIAATKVKVSTGNRQVHAKILQPQSLKSKSLTRVRWVRGPLFSTMSPQEKIVKKKGAAHG